jgi:fructose-1,6-bisphosphatase I/sedoheptulose-1,7-bisphosphatase
MPTGGKSTLTQFIIESRRAHPGATGDLNGLVTAAALACKAISRRVALGALNHETVAGATIPPLVEKSLEQISNRMFLRASEWGGHVAGILSEQTPIPYRLPAEFPRGKYLLVFHPLDGSSNVDINVPAGSIFSIYRAATPGRDASPEDFLQPGTAQVCAGYAIYGPATMLVLTFGSGTHGFTLDPHLGEWVLSHPKLTIPAQSQEFAINATLSRFWEPAVKRYVDECLDGKLGPREADFNLRWVASLVAETHRILMRGGICLYPRDTKDPGVPGRMRLLFEASPIAFLVEQAGGLASTGRGRVLEVIPESLEQRSGFVFGSSDEVSRVETYHREDSVAAYRSPLFGARGLFASED